MGSMLFKGQFTPHRQTPTNSNKLVCWSLLDQCVIPLLALVSVGWSWLEFVFTRLNMLIRPIHTAQTNANKLQQTSWLKLAVGFRILWKITVMFTLHQQTPTNSISISMFSRVKTNSNQLQPTLTNANRGITHWSNKLQQTSLLEFVGVCLCGVNWPIDIELVGVCWCSVNMTVIFHKILNPTANLSQLVCWSLLAFVCAVWIGL